MNVQDHLNEIKEKLPYETSETYFTTVPAELVIKQETYVIDFTKVNTIEDIKNILSALDIKVYGNCKVYNEMRQYLKPEKSE